MLTGSEQSGLAFRRVVGNASLGDAAYKGILPTHYTLIPAVFQLPRAQRDGTEGGLERESSNADAVWTP